MLISEKINYKIKKTSNYLTTINSFLLICIGIWIGLIHSNTEKQENTQLLLSYGIIQSFTYNIIDMTLSLLVKRKYIAIHHIFVIIYTYILKKNPSIQIDLTISVISIEIGTFFLSLNSMFRTKLTKSLQRYSFISLRLFYFTYYYFKHMLGKNINLSILGGILCVINISIFIFNKHINPFRHKLEGIIK